ncbi:MAG: TlpA disulfide reductase family protein [Bacteroidota bacterium]
MKRTIALLSLLCSTFFALSGYAQDNGSKRKIPASKIKDLKGAEINTETLSNNGKPMVISFWATWCKPCVNELSAIAETYEDWQAETGVKIVAVSIDDARNVAKVGPMINTKGWEYQVLTDQNGDFKRVMNVNTVPHTFLIDGEGNIVWQHNAYAPGDEKELYEKIKKLSKGESIQ